MSWNYLFLVIAVGCEVLATSTLKLSDGFTRLGPSLATVVGYAFAFYFLSLPLRTMPVGVVYALWCGAGIIFITAIGWVWFRQPLDLPAIGGIALIMVGVMVINLFSSTLNQ
jgi:small multidrug resistance pump